MELRGFVRIARSFGRLAGCVVEGASPVCLSLQAFSRFRRCGEFAARLVSFCAEVGSWRASMAGRPLTPARHKLAFTQMRGDYEFLASCFRWRHYRTSEMCHRCFASSSSEDLWWTNLSSTAGYRSTLVSTSDFVASSDVANRFPIVELCAQRGRSDSGWSGGDTAFVSLTAPGATPERAAGHLQNACAYCRRGVAVQARSEGECPNTPAGANGCQRGTLRGCHTARIRQRQARTESEVQRAHEGEGDREKRRVSQVAARAHKDGAANRQGSVETTRCTDRHTSIGGQVSEAKGREEREGEIGSQREPERVRQGEDSHVQEEIDRKRELQKRNNRQS